MQFRITHILFSIFSSSLVKISILIFSNSIFSELWTLSKNHVAGLGTQHNIELRAELNSRLIGTFYIYKKPKDRIKEQNNSFI